MLLQTATPSAPASPGWIPIRSLTAQHCDTIAAHLRQLDEQDRYLRFGHAATDAHIDRYVDTLDFARAEVFGIFNRHLELIAMAHLAPSPITAGTEPMAEFGVSVLKHARGRGYGQRLFDHAAIHARNRGVKTLFIHALSENAAMLNIARKAGATVEREGSESEAWVKLPADTLSSHVGALVEEHAAELDFRLKAGAHQVSALWNTLSDTRAVTDAVAPAEPG